MVEEPIEPRMVELPMVVVPPVPVLTIATVEMAVAFERTLPPPVVELDPDPPVEPAPPGP